jgi:hypothetical protein
MTRRKREITGLANERDFPHVVELAVPPEGFHGAFLEFDAFHREHRIPVRRSISAQLLGMRFAANWPPNHLGDSRAFFDELLHGFRLDLIARSREFDVNLSEPRCPRWLRRRRRASIRC